MRDNDEDEDLDVILLIKEKIAALEILWIIYIHATLDQ